MLKIDRVSDGSGVRLVLSGRIEREGLEALQRALRAEACARTAIAIDTQEVRLLDREAVQFLVQCAAYGVRLVNTPAYVREWMNREQNGLADDAHESPPRDERG